MKKIPSYKLFIELAKPDKNGWSRQVPVTEFVGKYSPLMFNNGGTWCRKRSALNKIYNVEILKLYKKNKTSHIQLTGFNKNHNEHVISKKVRDHFKGERCAILDIGSGIQIDHKDGRNDDGRVNDTKKQSERDFQPLSTAANVAKRSHCKECVKTNIRFDATKLGYKVSQHTGNKEYQGSCVGCYWYDPIEFNEEISIDFKKEY